MIHVARSTPTALFIALLAGVGPLAGCDQSGMDGPDPETFTAPLTALNNSGVSGKAIVAVEDDYEVTLPVACGTPAQWTAPSETAPQHAPIAPTSGAKAGSAPEGLVPPRAEPPFFVPDRFASKHFGAVRV